MTGGNRGIGLAIARGLAQLGPKYTVIITARKQADVDAAVAKLQAEKLKVYGRVLDVASSESVAALAAWIEAEVGILHVLVNNAGILTDAELTISTFDEARTLDQFNVNCVGAMRVTRAVLPLMRRGKYGRIVYLASRAGQLTQESGCSMPGYRISKTAMNMAMHLQHKELEDTAVAGEDIIISSMCPGYIATDMTETAVRVAGWESKPSKTPEEGADTAIFLATLPAGSPNGQFWAEREFADW